MLKPKLFSALKNYSAEQFLQDVVAGIIVAIIALPLSIALAIASGVGPEAGIYTAILAGFLVSLLGGSMVQIAGPTAAFATIVAGIVAKDGMNGLVVATILAGLILICMGLFRFGGLLKFIPYTITTGFTAGIAVTLFIGQIKDFAGITYEHGEEPIETFEKLHALAANIGTINIQAVLIGVLALAILILWPKLVKKIPGFLVAVIVTAAIVEIFHLDVNTIGKAFADIPSGLPRFSLNSSLFSVSMIRAQFGNAVVIAVLAGIESLLSAVVADSMINAKHSPNMELIAQGIANIGSACFGGIPATGAIARTAANIKNGGRTPIAGIVHSISLLIVVVFLMPFAKLIPLPCIAAILFQVAYNMSGWRKFVDLCKSSPKSDILILVVTFAFTVIFDLVVAIEAGIILAAVLFMKRMSDETEIRGWKTEIDEDKDPDAIKYKKVPAKTMVYEITGPLFFAVADDLLKIDLEEKLNYIIVRMRGVPALDASAMNRLEEMLAESKKKNIQLIFSHVNEQPMKLMQKNGFVERVGQEYFCKNIDEALEKAAE